MEPMTSPFGCTITGLVSGNGSSGGSVGGTGKWSLIFHLAAWRQPDGTLVTGKRRCVLDVDKSELSSLMAKVTAYSIVEVEVDGVPGERETKLRRIVRIGTHDSDLAKMGDQLQEPVVLSDSRFGTLLYDRRFGWYAGHVVWCGQEVEISLSCKNPENVDAVFDAAGELFSAQPDWKQRIEDLAVAELLPLKNDSWLDESEKELTRDDFLSRMTLQAIQVDESGAFTFWHDDGEMFLGHSIEISGDLANGATRADIPG